MSKIQPTPSSGGYIPPSTPKAQAKKAGGPEASAPATGAPARDFQVLAKDVVQTVYFNTPKAPKPATYQARPPRGETSAHVNKFILRNFIAG